MIFLKKTKLKLKKSAWIALGSILGGIILIIIIIIIILSIRKRKRRKRFLARRSYIRNKHNF